MMKNIEYNYRPIDPKSPIEIKVSKIDGLGLFAKANISAGTYLGTTHILVDGDLIRTPMGGFINCSKTPNAKLFQLPKVKRSNYVLRLCVCLPLAKGFNLTTNLMGQIAQNRC